MNGSDMAEAIEEDPERTLEEVERELGLQEREEYLAKLFISEEVLYNSPPSGRDF